MANSPIKLTPFYSIAQRLNAQFTEHHGWNIPEVYTTRDAEIDAARRSVVLADETANGKLTVEGDWAETVVNAAFDLPALAINMGGAIESSYIYRLRNDLFFVTTPPEGEDRTRKKLTAATKASGEFVTITDVTHGQAEIRVIGPASQELLSKVCSLNFHSSEFPNGVAKQTSLAKTDQLIIRRDIGELPAFSVIGVRSLGAYVWDTIVEAGCEFGLVPIGRVALRALDEQRDEESE